MNKEKIRFVILKETESGELFNNIDEEKLMQLDLGFNWKEFEDQVGYLVQAGYLTKPFYADDTIYYFNSVLTEKGEKYLKDNKLNKKAYRVAKEIKEWLSLL
ncbi:YjcQ family protein [Paenibacillus motobuensis]|uniref:YjcQ family protein n=1 Tax=Paenibacillus motobuensis TaxID=295324 RepID=A0ABN0Y8S5_9BACL